MDNSTAPLAAAIGARVRQHRQARGWTLEQLASAAAVSRRMIINVEQGEANPSVGTLLKISDALGIGLPALVEPSREAGIRVTPRGGGAALWQGESGGSGVMVSATGSPHVVELWNWTLRPGEQHRSTPHSPGTREIIEVTAGTVEIGSGEHTVTLDEGDAATFDGDVPHSYANVSNDEAQFSLVVFEPRGAAHEA